MRRSCPPPQQSTRLTPITLCDPAVFICDLCRLTDFTISEGEIKIPLIWPSAAILKRQHALRPITNIIYLVSPPQGSTTIKKKKKKKKKKKNKKEETIE